MNRSVLALLLALTSCTWVQQGAKFTAADAANAAAMAKAATDDPQAKMRAACYGSWNTLAGGLAALPGNEIGIFTGVEAGIEVEGTLKRPDCQAVAGAVVMWALRRAPVGGNLIP